MSTVDRNDSLGAMLFACIALVAGAWILLLSNPPGPAPTPPMDALPVPEQEKQQEIGERLKASDARSTVIVHGSQAQYVAAIPMFPNTVVAWEKVECINGRCPPARYTVERDGSSWECTSLQSAMNHLRASP